MNRSSQDNRRWRNTWIFLGCTLVLLLVLGAFQTNQAAAKQSEQDQPVGAVERISFESGNIEPDGSQGERLQHQVFSPANVFGLVASLSGALVLGTSLMILSRRRA